MKSRFLKIIAVTMLSIIGLFGLTACNADKSLTYDKTVASVVITKNDDGRNVTLTGEAAKNYASKFLNVEMSLDTLMHGLNATLTTHYTVTITYEKPKIGKAKVSTFTVGETSVRQNGNTEYDYPRRVQKGKFAGSCSDDALSATRILFN